MILTTAQVAQRYDVDESTVRRWCRDRRIVAVRLGGVFRALWRIPEASLLGFDKPKAGRPANRA